VVLTLVRTGTLQKGDFLGTQTYQLADGSTVPSRTFRIRSLTVGDRVIQNVIGSMTNVEGSLLLGQSFLSRFKRVSFDYGLQVLVLE
jgi:aspartyl protease family protein